MGRDIENNFKEMKRQILIREIPGLRGILSCFSSKPLGRRKFEAAIIVEGGENRPSGWMIPEGWGIEEILPVYNKIYLPWFCNTF